MIYILLFLEFFKIGLFTFGGGYAMIPLLNEVIIKRSWLSQSAFLDFLGVCEATPGPIAVNMATFIGYNQMGVLGALTATFAVILPSFIIILFIASLFKNIIDNKIFKRIMSGIKPVIIGLIIFTGLSLTVTLIGYQNIDNTITFDFDLISLIILLCISIIYFLFKIVLKKKLSPVILILISIVVGIVTNLLIL